MTRTKVFVGVLVFTLVLILCFGTTVHAGSPTLNPPELNPPELNPPDLKAPDIHTDNHPSSSQDNTPSGTNQPALDFTRGDTSIDFIHKEIIKNLDSKELKEIKNDWNCCWGLKKPKALYKFYQVVKANGPWDHKPQLQKLMNLRKIDDFYYPIKGDNQHEYFYDLYSNIHYAYIGRAAGLPESLLTRASNVHLPGVGRTDPGDNISLDIGYELYDKHKGDPSKLTAEEIRQAILAKRKKYESVETTQVQGIKDGK
ncbi:hypothetical protein GCM10011571_24490 [Marinithermofilum abyssi]|jgi:hypothetical protein|uniref:Bacterial toxin 44 domain-containing protein n=1 Tax=Marinithermofilum abyssi TaxID=1571185 RepID=A0A8J2VIE0_9BACL|nr:polymorphic toxin type 44 domain-containing protein [Marinithermofilum abyssi]GGE21518.1 hypothetical protein GCM10011571_24490 [Marinithermofilum abyssi]